MGKKILDSKLLYALLAIVIAIGLWVYVATVENPDKEMTLTGIPITFVNEEILEANGLIISSGRGQTATLTVVGPRTTVAKLSGEKENITLSIDVGRITTPGEQRMAYSITMPSLSYSASVQVTNRTPGNVDFTVSRRISKEISVEGKFTGSLAEGYMKDEFTILPGKITIAGIESDVNQVDYAQVTVGETDMSATFTGEMGFTLIGFEGEELTDLKVDCSTETVLVTMPVLKTASIPLAVKLVPGGGVTDVNKQVSYEITPSSITVSGAEEDLEPLKEILLGEIELSNIISSNDTFEFEIPLNAALENISGVTRATVSVSIRGLETKVLEVDNIEVINPPDGFEAEKVTQSLQVLVRGAEEAIDLVFPYHLRVVADLSGVDAAAGRFTVPVRVYLDGTSEVGVVGNDYKIVVDIFR